MNMPHLPHPENILGLAAAVAGLWLAIPRGPLPPMEAAPDSLAAIGPIEESPLRDRVAFAHALVGVKEGMSLEEVRRRLGEPDDVWNGDEVEAGPWWAGPEKMTQIWAFGGAGHLTFPTLGRVGFDRNGKVVAVLCQAERRMQRLTRDAQGRLATVGPNEPLVGSGLPGEPEARRILRLIDGLKRYDQHNDPLRVIQVVNALQPLGKIGALSVIDEYLRVSDQSVFGGGRDGLFVVVRCLFEVPDPPGHFPGMGVGQPHPASPANPRKSPRFPVVLFRDIPFSGINGYSLAGFAEPIEWHLEGYRDWGKIRSAPLRPPDDPLAVIDELVKSPEWPDWGDDADWGKSVAREQALRLVASVYRSSADSYDSRLTGWYADQDPQWKGHRERFPQLGARWDPRHNCYVRKDGSFETFQPEPYPYPRTWRVQLPSGTVKIQLKRRNRLGVDYWVSNVDAKPPLPRVRFFRGSTELAPGSTMVITDNATTCSGFDAPAGSEIRVVLEVSGKKVAEKVLRP